MAGLLKVCRQPSFAWSPALRAAFLLSCLFIGFARLGNAANSPETSRSASGPTAAQFAIADFDGDSRPDIASVHAGQSGSRDALYLIDFRLTGGLRQTIGVTAPTGGLQLRSRDVNGDSYPDVVVTTFWTNQPVAVLLNDGRGNFTQSDPSEFQGAFATSENSRISMPAAINDAAAALWSRNSWGEREECERASSPQTVAEHLVTSAFHFAGLSRSDPFFGRAPPSPALHR
jgi:FG-GAP-like repeat